jgi:hypothetical protein
VELLDLLLRDERRGKEKRKKNPTANHCQSGYNSQLSC